MVRAPLHFHGRIPVPEVAPLTYRDGVTHLELVYELSQYLKNVLHPSLQSTVDQVVADAEKLLSEANAQYVDGVQEFQRIHDAFMSDVNAYLIALNDGAVSDLVADETSLLGKTLREYFTSHEAFQEYVDTIDYRFGKLVTDIDQQHTDFLADFDEKMGVIETYLAEYDTRLTSVESLYPEYYGAAGDDTGDDADAMQDWADAGNTTLKPGSTYRVSKGMRFNRDHVRLFGNGSTIHMVGDNAGMAVNVTGNYAVIESLILTGDGGVSRGGIRVTGDYSSIKNNTITNFYAEASAYGILLSSRRGGHHVSNNTVKNISATNIGQTDGRTGISRGVYMNTQDTGLNAQDITVMEGNFIDGVYGLEGDGIQILLNQHSEQAGPRDRGYVSIVNNIVDNCSRRCIKVQSSYVEVVNNVLRDSRSETKRFPQPMLDIILVSNFTAHGNDIRVGGHNGGIYLRNLYSRSSYMTITNNTVQSPHSSPKTNIYVDNVLYSSIERNTIIGGYRGVAISNASTTSVSYNTIHSIASRNDVANPVGIVAQRSCSTVFMVGNVDMTWSAGHTSIQNRSDNGVTSNNVSVGR